MNKEFEKWLINTTWAIGVVGVAMILLGLVMILLDPVISVSDTDLQKTANEFCQSEYGKNAGLYHNDNEEANRGTFYCKGENPLFIFCGYPDNIGKTSTGEYKHSNCGGN